MTEAEFVAMLIGVREACKLGFSHLLLKDTA